MSAEPSNILPFPGEPLTLDQLVQHWIEAKRDEDAANTRRVRIELQIVALQPPREEGSSTHELAGGFKLTLTGKLSYRVVDMTALQALSLQLPPDKRPLKQETKLDETGAKWLRTNAPDLWKLIAPAIEVKPAKVAVKVGI